ncbi:MAG: hypothetical protein IJ111_02655 [Eggerthellaceae bacterium]|nr:hypothetical protein [Eggerthellaceae bacterium]
MTSKVTIILPARILKLGDLLVENSALIMSRRTFLLLISVGGTTLGRFAENE